MNGLLAIANRHIDEIAAIRRDIHANPELGFEERRTSGIIASKLQEWGIDVTQGIAQTGVVGTIRGKRPGSRSIGLRADMDALAMCEFNSFAHTSTIPGRMHACGHDGHTAMLLGAAQALAEHPDFAGTVHVIFQPAEEGRGGALAMMGDALFERFPCDRIFGMHSYPVLPLGKFGIRKEAMMAASGRFQVEFTGSGGHGGASPHTSVDLSVVAAHFLLALQTIVGRNVPPLETAIISVGHIGAGDPNALNVIPAKLQISGTMRAFTAEVQELIETRITAHAKAFAQSEGASADVKCWWLSEPLINDSDATDSALAAAIDVAGVDAVIGNHPRVTAGEDFASMMRMRPGAYVLIGNGRHEGDGGGNVHTPRYDFNDQALPLGIAYWLSIVNKELDGRMGAA
ncbi:M20 aminoacylase family protein [Paraburkholderia antibiotica]|uniref:Amidohydrolase n=1 Tax=Paraburkholderia antibiotica TaxID=2728839 RepID=A0A7Y0FGQ1_9BURK|nr:M20 aminoacylase family protein [Paraburkholderia antibiotica]NML35387.1 amidohydrolase [Paraburkholderia antibiotica]